MPQRGEFILRGFASKHYDLADYDEMIDQKKLKKVIFQLNILRMNMTRGDYF
jgi:hypothetical protein